MGKAIEPVYTYVAAMRERRSYKYPVPDGQEMELEEQRSIFSLLGEKKEKKKEKRGNIYSLQFVVMKIGIYLFLFISNGRMYYFTAF